MIALKSIERVAQDAYLVTLEHEVQGPRSFRFAIQEGDIRMLTSGADFDKYTINNNLRPVLEAVFAFHRAQQIDAIDSW